MGKYNQLSPELIARITEDRRNNVKCPYAFNDEKIIRRNMEHDKANIWRPAFVRDIEKIMHIPYYNRYADKTQVFSFYKNDDISRRALHVQFVSRIARNIGAGLGLNLDLIEAIALGHDIGHTPFGHAGESMLDEIYNAKTGRRFNHNVHSVRVLDKIVDRNISLQVLDGILCHNGEMECKEYRPVVKENFDVFDKEVEDCYIDSANIKKLIPSTLEGCVVRISDIIAYIGKDRQDAMKLNMIDKTDIFSDGGIGTSNAEIINNLIVNIIENSYGKPYLLLDDEHFKALSGAKTENYKIIYKTEDMDGVYKNIISPMVERVYEELFKQAESGSENNIFYHHHIKYIDEINRYSKCHDKPYRKKTSANDMVVDFIASMTDDYFMDLYEYLFNEKSPLIYKGYFDELPKF